MVVIQGKFNGKALKAIRTRHDELQLELIEHIATHHKIHIYIATDAIHKKINNKSIDALAAKAIADHRHRSTAHSP